MRYHSLLPAVLALCLALPFLHLQSARAEDGERSDSRTITYAEDETSRIELASVLQSTGRPKIGLALGGGGARGAAHIGVLKVLEKEGIPIDCISGTSIGAIVGGLYAAGLTVEQLENIVEGKKIVRSYYTVPIWLRVAAIPIFSIPHLLGHSHYEGLYRGGRFKNYIESVVPPEHRMIENTNIPFCGVAASLVDGKSHCFRTGNLAQVIQASSAIPILRRPVEIDGQLLVDGGIVNNLPVIEARNLGADIVIAVDVDETFDDKNLAQFKRVGSVGNRVINMILCRVDQDVPANADMIIHPNVNGIKLLSTSKKDALKAIAAGEGEARAQLALIRRLILSRSGQKRPEEKVTPSI